MGGRQERQDIIDSGGRGSYSRWQDGSQRVHKATRDRGKKAFGSRDTAVKAALRRERIDRSQRELTENLDLDNWQEGLRFLEERRQFQLYRALGHILENRATPLGIDYFFRHADELGPTATVCRETIVDFTDPAKKELPDAA